MLKCLEYSDVDLRKLGTYDNVKEWAKTTTLAYAYNFYHKTM